MALNSNPLGFIFSNPLPTIRGENSWPPENMKARWDDVRTNRAWRNNDEAIIRAHAVVSGMGGDQKNQPGYFSAPLARRTSEVAAHTIAGDAPIVTVDNDTDEDRRNQIIKLNSLTKKIRAGIAVSSSEGGVYGKVTVDPTTPLGRRVPLISFIPEDAVIPVFVGLELTEATIVHEWAEGDTLYRLFERHQAGSIEYTLRKGCSNIAEGTIVPLTACTATAAMQPTVLTGIDELLVVYIPNHRDSGPYGLSDYFGVKDMFIAINEVLTTTQSSVRTTEARLITDQLLLDEHGNLPSGANVLHANKKVGELGEVPLLQSVAPTFQAQNYVAWSNALINLTLTLQGISPETFGLGVDGGVPNAAATRLKTAHTRFVMRAKGEYWEDGLSTLLRLAAILDQQTYTVGGLTKQGVAWEVADAEVTVTMRDGNPVEYITSAQDLVQLKTAGLISEELSITTLHPTFSPADTQDEMDRLANETAAQAGSLGAAAAQAVAGLTLPPVLPPTDPANPNAQ